MQFHTQEVVHKTGDEDNTEVCIHTVWYYKNRSGGRFCL